MCVFWFVCPFLRLHAPGTHCTDLRRWKAHGSLCPLRLSGGGVRVQLRKESQEKLIGKRKLLENWCVECCRKIVESYKLYRLLTVVDCICFRNCADLLKFEVNNSVKCTITGMQAASARAAYDFSVASNLCNRKRKTAHWIDSATVNSRLLKVWCWYEYQACKSQPPLRFHWNQRSWQWQNVFIPSPVLLQCIRMRFIELGTLREVDSTLLRGDKFSWCHSFDRLSIDSGFTTAMSCATPDNGCLITGPDTRISSVSPVGP